MNSNSAQIQDVNVTSEEDQQYLTFILEGEEYGVDILKVHEIKGWTPTTLIPNTPPYMKGVINLRGSIVPVIDLRQRFGLSALEYGPTTVVIVLNVISTRDEQMMGMVVDAVSDTYSIAENLLKPSPDVGGAISTDFITGLASIDEKMVIILDIDHLLNAEEMASLAATAER